MVQACMSRDVWRRPSWAGMCGAGLHGLLPLTVPLLWKFYKETGKMAEDAAVLGFFYILSGNYLREGDAAMTREAQRVLKYLQIL